jgi:hypothetical protein
MAAEIAQLASGSSSAAHRLLSLSDAARLCAALLAAAQFSEVVCVRNVDRRSGL